MEPVVRGPGEGETITERAERTVRILFEHELADVTWSRYEPGERGPDPHVHREHADAFYVLEGELEFGAGPTTASLRAPAGTLVAVPPGVVHTFGNESGATARFLNVHAPSRGFAASLRGDEGGFDSSDPPADGGLDPDDVVVTRAGGGERFDRGDRLIVITASLAELSTLEIEFDPAFSVSPHTHDDHVDSFLVLAGEVEFTLAERVVRAGPGTWMSAPPGAVHGFRTRGPGRARVLNLHAPDAGFADGVRRT